MAAFLAPTALPSTTRPTLPRRNKPLTQASARRPDVSLTTRTAHHDGPFALASIALFRRAMRPSIGWQSPRPGYAGFVEECRMLMARLGPAEQQKTVRRTLNTLFFSPLGTTLFRRHFSDNAALNAAITPLFFSWLVGPAANNRPKEGGYGVKIEKCRFLDESGCKGLCVNMCQQPTQSFFTDVLGLPVRMTPDYDDLSCQMTFGLAPLPLEEDPAITGECFTDCKMSGPVRRRGDKTCYVSPAEQ